MGQVRDKQNCEAASAVGSCGATEDVHYSRPNRLVEGVGRWQVKRAAKNGCNALRRTVLTYSFCLTTRGLVRRAVYNNGKFRSLTLFDDVGGHQGSAWLCSWFCMALYMAL